jgi:hypothetical protein
MDIYPVFAFHDVNETWHKINWLTAYLGVIFSLASCIAWLGYLRLLMNTTKLAYADVKPTIDSLMAIVLSAISVILFILFGIYALFLYASIAIVKIVWILAKRTDERRHGPHPLSR